MEETVSDHLEASYQQCLSDPQASKVVGYTTGTFSYQADLDKMVQTNLSSNK